MPEDLASCRRCLERVRATWPAFLDRRRDRLTQQERHGVAAEKVAENIVEDLFTGVLDWTIADLNHQLGYADIVLSRLGIKYLILEVKRPGALAWNRRAVDAALDQARRYADEQRVRCIGVTDGLMLYAADIQHGGLVDRVFARLDANEPPEALWWLSVHGIYRPREDRSDAAIVAIPTASTESEGRSMQDIGVLHPRYKIPACCFAYVADASDPGTWKLPYRLDDGQVDLRRLPKAIQSILSNYRGTRVSGIPEAAIPEVLVRLAHAAASLEKMPHQTGNAAPVYRQLAAALDQLEKLQEIMS